MSEYSLHHGDCLDVLPGLPLVDSIVTDPPAGIGFMGAEWDKDKGGRDAWVAWLATRLRAARERLRPGGYALVWALPKTSHWTACAIEDAGLVIQDRVSELLDGNDLMAQFLDGLTPDQRDAFARAMGGPARLQSIFGSGFPKHKSHLKPAVEDWWLAYNPGGARALQVEACRVEGAGQERHATAASGTLGRHGIYGSANETLNSKQVVRADAGLNPRYDPAGRWPPHLLLTHSADCDEAACSEGCPVAILGAQSGARTRQISDESEYWSQGGGGYRNQAISYGYTDTGTAARFFPQFRYVAKASRRERETGLEGREPVEKWGAYGGETEEGAAGRGLRPRPSLAATNHHPTVKPLALMRWLVRLVTPPGGIVLDPFLGSGSTGCAAVLEGLRFVGVEQSAEYLEIARARIAHYADPLRHMEAA